MDNPTASRYLGDNIWAKLDGTRIFLIYRVPNETEEQLVPMEYINAHPELMKPLQDFLRDVWVLCFMPTRGNA